MPDLDDWPNWDVPFSGAPRLLRELGGGYTNRTYLIEVDESLWAVRLDTPDGKRLGIDREREAAVVQRAVAAGLSPAVAFHSLEHGVLITAYIDGGPLDTETLAEPGKLERFLDFVKRVHELKIETPRLDYYAHAERYWRTLGESGIECPDALIRARDEVLAGRSRYPLAPFEARLCHHDLTPQNFIENGDQLYLLDWEYAAYGAPVFDYAAICVEWSVPIGRLQEHTGADLEELRHAVALYRYTCGLWMLINRASGLGA